MNFNQLIKSDIAHRGFHSEQIPENSLKSFERAIELNYPIELDLHIIKDGTIIVFHDDNLKRMCSISKKVKELTTEELSSCYLKGTEETIPTFAQVLNLINGQVPIVIELKYDVLRHKLDKGVANLLKKYKGDYIIKSFLPSSVLWWKRHYPQTKRGLLIAVSNQSKKQLFLIEHLYWLLKPDFISYEKGYYNRKFLQKMGKKQLPILFWTIQNKEEYVEAKKYDAGYLIEKMEKW